MLTVERIDDLSLTHLGNVGIDYENFARAIESAACAERDARIAELNRSLEVMAKNTEEQAGASVLREIELTEKIAELEQQLQAYEKRGVTCQTFRHFVSEPCAECNSSGRCAKKLERELEEARKDAEELKFLNGDLLYWVARAVSNGNANSDTEDAYERYEQWLSARHNAAIKEQT